MMDNRLFYILKNSGIPLFLRYFKAKKGLATVLCLHRIADTESASWPPMKISDFERLLQYITKHYFPTTIAGLSNGSFEKKPPIVLSFDDGFRDFYENGIPLLKKFGIPCNLNVVTNCLDGNFSIWTQRLNDIFDSIWRNKTPINIQIKGITIIVSDFEKKSINSKGLEIFHQLFNKDEIYIDEFLSNFEMELPFKVEYAPMMNWADLKKGLLENEIELGSHSCSHYTLTNITNNLKLKEEIYNSKLLIEEITGRDVSIFAAPNGKYDANILSISKAAGYKHFLTVDEELITPDNFSSFKKARILIAYADHAQNMLKVENFQNHIKKMINRRK